MIECLIEKCLLQLSQFLSFCLRLEASDFACVREGGAQFDCMFATERWSGTLFSTTLMCVCLGKLGVEILPQCTSHRLHGVFSRCDLAVMCPIVLIWTGGFQFLSFWSHDLSRRVDLEKVVTVFVSRLPHEDKAVGVCSETFAGFSGSRNLIYRHSCQLNT